MITLVAAMAKDRAIGNHNQLLWHLPADLQHFKQLTTGRPIIMGRKTWDSIGRPLPNRHNIVLSRDIALSLEGCSVAHTPQAAIELANADDICVIGGSAIYALFLPLAQRMELTLVDGEYEADAYFPEWDTQQWQEIHNTPQATDAANPIPYRFLSLERIAGG